MANTKTTGSKKLSKQDKKRLQFEDFRRRFSSFKTARIVTSVGVHKEQGKVIVVSFLKEGV